MLHLRVWLATEPSHCLVGHLQDGTRDSVGSILRVTVGGKDDIEVTTCITLNTGPWQ